MKTTLHKAIALALLSVLTMATLEAQFIHPGLTHKKSDLERMKYQIEAQINPWYASYQEMVADSKSSYDYVVRGNTTFTEVGRDNGVNYGAWNSDIRAAYYNAIRWQLTGDVRHAQKCVEIFNAWVGITNVSSGGTESLSGGTAYIMLEAAEIIKSTYTGWSAADIKKFQDMLVYPGYSTTAKPSGNTSFYWKSYQGDAGRHGNQGLSGWRTVMAMGIFMDNQIMYDRALRYLKGLPHRSDDLPYASGPNQSIAITASDDFADTYSTKAGSSVADYGFNDVLTNYIWENGQCQESSRDQQHVFFGIGLIQSMAEIAWNQGENLYGHSNERLFLGLNYNLKFNVSALHSFPDQTTPWIPTVSSGEFLQRFDRTGRWYSKSVSTIGMGEFPGVRPLFEVSVGHYVGRGLKTEEQAKWMTRARDIYIDEAGYEKAGWSNDQLGWGAITMRRPELCYGDPVSNINNEAPVYGMNILPGKIEAENFDYSPINGNGRTYYDDLAGNKGAVYRTNEDADIQASTEGGYHLGWLNPGEWMTYTAYVPTTGTYNISVRYSGNSADGKIKFSFGGNDKTGEVALPSTAGWQNWSDYTVAQGVLLSKGVQSIRVYIGGTKSAINLNSFSITTSTSCVATAPVTVASLKAGVKYNYYEGTWSNLPDFSKQSIVKTGTSTSIKLGNGEITNAFAYDFNGYIKLSTEGTYTFYTNSDDGSKLFIDDAEIVNNDGAHGAIEKSGSICLKAGYHKIRVQYFDKSGGKSLSISYAGPSITKQTINNLYYSDEVVTDIENAFDAEEIASIYPNPFNNTITVQLNSSTDTKIEILNTLGQIVATQFSNSEVVTLDLNHVNNGLYIVKITSDNRVITKEILKK